MLPNKQTKLNLAILLMAAALCMAAVSYAAPMGTAFTYQGQLADANSPAEGLYDFEFAVFDALDGGTQQGSTLSEDDKDVIDGYFTVTLDFGAGVFTGDARWLQIAVRRANSTEDFTTLSPRQELTPTPYALYAKTADTGHSLDAADGSPTNAVYVHNNGNVGIGTTSPGAKLHVSAGHIRLDAGYALRAGSTSMVYQNAGNTIINALSTDEIYFTGSGLPNMVIQNSTGNIGIGTLNPEGLLHITRYGDKQLMLGHDNQPLREWYFEVDGAAKMTLNNEAAGSPIMVMSFDSNMGNVGIGTSSPDAKLTVDGAFLREGSTMYGSNADTHINLGTTSTTGTNGQNYSSATVGGGWDNTASGFRSTISGGALNEASAFQTAIGGGGRNTASGDNATVGGGGANTASGHWSTVGGGTGNTAIGQFDTIGGGSGNIANGFHSTIAGGEDNTASGSRSTVGGGENNTASGSFLSTVAGGSGNTASAYTSTVGGGDGNTAGGSRSTVSGGGSNTADGHWSTVAGGISNTASGGWSTVSGGRKNIAAGDYSFAAGYRAKANHEGAFVWSDSTNVDFASTGENQFLIRASGGVYFYTNSGLSTGAYLASGSGSWSSVSDRAAKEDFASVDTGAVLEKLVSVPITTWKYKPESDSVRHIGPMAQDLYAAFGLGDSDKHITTIDADGISFAAIQGLYQLVQEKDAEIAELKERFAKMEAAISQLIKSNEGGQL